MRIDTPHDFASATVASITLTDDTDWITVKANVDDNQNSVALITREDGNLKITYRQATDLLSPSFDERTGQMITAVHDPDVSA